jgi:lambda repressor-like predicted transcriptional regulator
MPYVPPFAEVSCVIRLPGIASVWVIYPLTVDRSSVYRQDQGMRITHPATLRALIRQRGFSYASLGAAVGCSKQFIGFLAIGYKAGATRELAERIAEALDVPLEIIFTPTASIESGQDVRAQKIAS